MTGCGSGVTRREVLLGAAGGITLAAIDPARARADEAGGATVSGLVFEDRDGSGVAGAANPGLPGVLVSNGRDVAATGPDGRYTLPLPDKATIFVVKPAGFMPPVDPLTRLPRFYRHHQPNGTPASLNLAFEGLAPTGPMPASLDFALKSQDEPKAFEVVMVTDPQPETEAEVDFIREDLIEALAGVDAKFGLTAGDIMFDDLSLYPRLNAIIGTIGLPWWNIGGNHDLNFEAPDRTYSRETYKRVFGPSYYAFFYAQTLFLMLDDVDYLGPDPAKPRGSGKYEGRLDEAQLEFVRGVLAKTPPETLVVAVLHIPIRTYLGAEPWQNLTNKEALFGLLEGRKHTVSFAGHTHTTEHHYFGAADGWNGAEPHHHHVLTALSGSWWSGPFDHRGVASADSRDGTPNGFHILSVDGTRCTTPVRPGQGAERAPDAALDRQPLPRDHQGRRPRNPPGAAPRLACAARRALRLDPDRQRLRRRRQDQGHDDRRRTRARPDDPRGPAGPVRRRGVRPQRGDQEGLGQRGEVVAHLDRPPARRPCARRLSGRGRGGRRIRPDADRAARARGDGVGERERRVQFWPRVNLFRGLGAFFCPKSGGRLRSAAAGAIFGRATP